jgi:hypothetical protein
MDYTLVICRNTAFRDILLMHFKFNDRRRDKQVSESK